MESDGSPFDYTAWAEYYPNNGFEIGGFAEDCGGFVKPSPPITPYSGCRDPPATSETRRFTVG